MKWKHILFPFIGHDKRTALTLKKEMPLGFLEPEWQ